MASVFSARSSPRISPVFLGLVLVTAAGGALTLLETRIAVTAMRVPTRVSAPPAAVTRTRPRKTGLIRGELRAE